MQINTHNFKHTEFDTHKISHMQIKKLNQAHTNIHIQLDTKIWTHKFTHPYLDTYIRHKIKHNQIQTIWDTNQFYTIKHSQIDTNKTHNQTQPIIFLRKNIKFSTDFAT